LKKTHPENIGGVFWHVAQKQHLPGKFRHINRATPAPPDQENRVQPASSNKGRHGRKKATRPIQSESGQANFMEMDVHETASLGLSRPNISPPP